MWVWPRVNRVPDYSFNISTIRAQISIDCENKCVYCGIHESKFGGERSFQVDHFRPKSILKFKKLEFEYSNLFWSCCVCNNLKRADWPSDFDSTQQICYLDPSLHDYNAYNLVCDNGVVESKNVAMRYMNERLGFNRSYLIYLRREDRALGKSKSIFSELNTLVEKILTNPIASSSLTIELTEAVRLLCKFHKINSLIQESKPYEPQDIKRTTV